MELCASIESTCRPVISDDALNCSGASRQLRLGIPIPSYAGERVTISPGRGSARPNNERRRESSIGYT